MRALIATAGAAIFAAILLYAYAAYLRRNSMFFPERFPLGDWNTAQYAIAPQNVHFTTSDDVRLHGWLIRSPMAQSPLLIWFHGNGGNITERAPIAEELARRGVSVLLFDWRGYGRSEGSPTESGLLQDATAAWQFASMNANPGDIVLYGESLGGPYAAYVAKTRPARCVIIENSFPSLRDLGNALYFPLPLGWLVPRALATTRWLNDARRPVLVMHGKADEVIPFRLGQRLYDGLTVPKEMLVSERGGHSEIPSAEGERYYETVTRFIRNSAR